jgi:phosphoglycerate dehydrogenase-like enzyme
MAEKTLVWVTEPIHEAAIAQLAAGVEVVGPGPLPPDRADEVVGVIVRAAEIRAPLVARLPHLRVVGKHGAGTDNIDVSTLQQRDIAFHSTSGTNADSVAELALCLSLMLLRAPDLHDAAIRQQSEPPRVTGFRGGLELADIPVGVVGMGAIGRAVAHRLKNGFGAMVAGYDPTLPDELWPSGVARIGVLTDLLSQVRMVFVHLPLNDSTRGLIGAEALACMPEGSFLVNCARGGIVDEDALAGALASGHIAGAASDVFAHEPPDPGSNPLFRSGRFIGTPHIGGSTDAALRRTGMLIVDKVLAQLKQQGILDKGGII